MRGILSLVMALTFPLILLAWVVALSHLEDTLPTDMRSARRTPDPPPILRVPVRVPADTAPVLVSLPAPQPGPATQPQPQPEPQHSRALPRIPRQRVAEDGVRAATS